MAPEHTAQCCVAVRQQRGLTERFVLQIGPFDKISVKGLTDFQPGKPLTVAGKKPDGSTYEFPVNQTFNDNQLTWFKAGSALNAMGQDKA